MKKMIFGKGTGSAKELPKKTHLSYVPQSQRVDVNRGPEYYTGGIPNQSGYVSSDDPDQFRKLYSDQDYLSFTGDPDVMREEGQLLPGDSAKRYDKNKPAGPVMEAGEAHENYFGLKDESAGYDKFNLGRPNEQEKYENKRFGRDLQQNLAKYRGKLPISGDLKLDDESFENWKELTGHTGAESRLRELFEDETIQALNLDNELKLAADAGYKPNDWTLKEHNIDMSEGRYKLNEARYQLNQDQKDLRHIAKANRSAANAMAKVEEHVAKGGDAADYLSTRKHLRDDLQGIHSFGQVDVDTQGFFDNIMYEGMDKQEKKEYDAKKEKEKQEELQLEADIQANLPAGSEEFNIPTEVSITGSEGDNEFVDANVNETITSGDESKEETFDPRDTNKDGTVDRKEKRAAMFADAYDPQASAMSKKPVFGTDEYYDFMKKKRTEEMGLTKRMFNIYDKN